MSATKTVQRLLIASCVAFLTACGVSSIEITGSYPTPNINKIPLTLGVYYAEDFKNFSYIEYTETGKEEYNIASGQSLVDLFDVILPAMFDRVVVVGDPDEGLSDENIDAVFLPAVEEFQLALPYKTRLDVFEVWMKYNMRLLTPEGEYIADWVLTSYGKTPQESFRSNEKSINAAAVVALRDLGSNFTLSFSSVPEVKEWLENR